ncbi:unnamed protein product [Microthlaspi erraticum]|uniref:AT3G52170-like helix-turn-helix domain-containing protein n=1 Tax=Microthlaspi erraticum TaxID=1685480 RepID=A0A6D2J053_9BRAS|nr:unnamed protein product [Microthlaspi erraticum]
MLKQLKQLTLSATRRNAGVVLRSRLYSSPAACQALTTPKTPKRLSRDDRRAAVESFIAEYRAANAGKYPTLRVIHKEVGGGYYVVRDIFQELKLNPKASLPIVAKALSEVSASVPNDASSQTLDDADTGSQSHSSVCNAEHSSPVVDDAVFQAESPDTVEIGSDQKQATIESSQPFSDEIILQGNNLDITPTRATDSTHFSSDESYLQENNVDITATRDSLVTIETGSDHKQATIESSHPVSDESNLQGNNLDITPTRDSPVTIETRSDQKQATIESSHPVSDESNLQGNNLDITPTRDSSVTIEAGSDHKQATVESSHPVSNESNLQGNKLDITATHDETATETAPKDGVGSKSVTNTHLPEIQTSVVSEECLKNPETEEEEKLTLLGSQKSEADHPEGAAVSANDLPTENRQVSEEGAGEVKTREQSGAWSNIMSFAKGFVDFWRKG